MVSLLLLQSPKSIGFDIYVIFSYTNAEVAIWKGSTWWCKKWSCPVQQWEGESVNLCKINIVLYLKYIMLNLYILANKLQIIQNVPTPTSFDLSIAADMLLSSGT